MITLNSGTNSQEALDVREVSVVVAKKPHTCSFSGKLIVEGEPYQSIVYTVGDNHFTYRVHLDEFQQFVKEKLFMANGQDYAEMEQDANLWLTAVAAFKEKYKDVPDFKVKMRRLKDIIGE